MPSAWAGLVPCSKTSNSRSSRTFRRLQSGFVSEREVARQSGNERCAQHCGLGLHQLNGIFKSKRTDEDGNGKTNSRQDSDRAHLQPINSVREFGQPELHRESAESHNAERLAQY